MFSGVVLTSLAAALSHAALFQRKARAGWLEELEDIRGDALEVPDGELANVVDGEDIWTDLREGGEYEDPHEISSLYADDDTPDLPQPKTPPRPARTDKPRGRPARRPRGEAVAPDAPVTEVAAPAPPPPVAAPAGPMPLVATAELAARQAADAMPAPAPAVPTPPAPGATADDDQIWVQPAPHPIRPQEMWHPAELAPPQLGEAMAPMVEERLDPADVGSASATSMFARSDPSVTHLLPEGSDAPAAPRPAVAADEQPTFDRRAADLVAAQLEAELAAVADASIAPASIDGDDTDAPFEGGTDPGLVANPVGRRNRRDRPSPRRRATLPASAAAAPTADFEHPVPDIEPLVERGERSPLPTAPLAPAALPARSIRLPELGDLPATPSSVVSPSPRSPFEGTPTPAALAPTPQLDHEATPELELEPEPERFDPTALVISEPALPVVEPSTTTPAAPAPSPAPEVAPVAPAAPPVAEVATPLLAGADGLLDVPGTIVRLGGPAQASATERNGGVLVDVASGWCWASPADGAQGALRIELPSAAIQVLSGATVLAVAEADGSSFVIVADGTADLLTDGPVRSLGRGAIAMIDGGGSVQVDQASDAEIEADPLVAENLGLDAEL